MGHRLEKWSLSTCICNSHPDSAPHGSYVNHPGVAENIAPVGCPGSHWPHPQLNTADWSHLCHTSITLCLSAKGTILHPAIVSGGNPFNNDITSWAPTGAIFSATSGCNNDFVFENDWCRCQLDATQTPSCTIFDIPATINYWRGGKNCLVTMNVPNMQFVTSHLIKTINFLQM